MPVIKTSFDIDGGIQAQASIYPSLRVASVRVYHEEWGSDAEGYLLLAEKAVRFLIPLMDEAGINRCEVRFSDFVDSDDLHIFEKSPHFGWLPFDD